MKTKEEILFSLEELREKWKKAPSRILEIRGKLLNLALKKMEEKRTTLFD